MNVFELQSPLTSYFKKGVISCFESMSEKDRMQIWSDGKYYECGDRFYLALTGEKFNKQIIGCLIITKTVFECDKPFVKELEVITLFVHPDYRRKHVAQTLLEIAKRRSHADLLLIAKVYKDNNQSVKLFTECGFFDASEYGDINKFADILSNGQTLFIADKGGW